MRAAAVRTTARIVAGAGLLAPVLVGGAGTAEAVTGPNLVVKSATAGSTSVAEGETLEISYATQNTGSRKARRSTTRFYLTRDWTASLEARRTSRTDPRSAPQDVLLDGASATAALRGGRTVTVSAVEVTVPVGTQPGRYTLVACADDRGRVAEGDEADNCTPTGQPLTVTAPAGNGTLELQQFADTAPWPDEDEEEWDLEMVQGFCSETVSARPMSLAGAITSTRRVIQRAVGVEAMQALDTSGQADDPVAAQELAGVAVMKGVPGLALAALLRAHEQEPRNATHLINAAGLAVSLGLPNQALAMLDGSVAGDLRRGAMGVSQQAIALVVRGEALLMTGQVRAAEGMFEAALEAEPMLSEAEAGLAHVEACLGHDGAALDHLRSSRQRTQGTQTGTTLRAGLDGRPRPVLDYDHGTVTPLRQLPLATTPAQTLKMRTVYEELPNQLFAELDAQTKEEVAIQERIWQTDDTRSWAEKQRRDGILGLAYAVTSDPEIVVRADEAEDQITRIMQVHEEFFITGPDGGDPTYTRLMDAAYEACDGSEVQNCYMVEMNARCRPALNKAHATWRDLMTELQEMLDLQLAEVSLKMSAYAANLKDPDAHRLAVLAIERYERDLYALLAQQADYWSGTMPGVEEECVAPLPAEILPTDQASPGQHQGLCKDDEHKKKSSVLAFGNVKMKVSCEKVSFEGAVETLPLLFAFAEMSVDRRTGKMTIFAGSKGEAKVVGVVEKGFKSGIYITSDIRTGEITDVGMRAGQSLSLDGRVAEYQVYEDMVDISFVPVFTTSDE